MRRRFLGLAGALVVLGGSAGTLWAADGCSNTQTPEALGRRVRELIAKMTVPERIAQLQDRAPGIPRLGLPAYNWWNEGLHGLARDGYATVFPQAIGLAATWDPALMRSVGDVVSTEARAKFNGHNGRGPDGSPRYGGLTVWSPNINIFRDPRWGRGQETYGEDPVLTGTMGVAFVRGVQGDDPFYLKADATPKHFAAHSGPEKNRDSFNSVVSAHDLNDTYLRAFHAVMTEGQAAATMCSYNEINGTPSCANEATLEKTVRERWGFKGYVVSDCDAVGDISGYHHFAPDAAHAAALALNAGTDLDCGDTYEALGKSYDQKLVSEEAINQALTRLLMARVRLGLLDAPGCTPFDGIGNAALDSPEHQALALRAAEESIVLLKNDGVLPLKPGARLAVMGPNADSLKILEANYHGTAVHPVTPLEGLLADRPDLRYAQGSLLAEGVPAPLPRNALFTGAEDGAAPGLKAEFFNRAEFGAQADVTAVVPKVDLDLDRVGPSPAVTARQYAARWSGFLRVPATGVYKLRVDMERCWDCTTHDSFRLTVDGKVLLDNHGRKGETDEATLQVSDMKAHAIRLELLHTGQDEGIVLEWVPPAEALLQQAKETAAGADAVVVFAGLSPDLEGEALAVTLPGFDGGDRTRLTLPEAQQRLLKALEATGKPLVVVVDSGSAVVPVEGPSEPNALLEAWYPGEAGGTAVANVLMGKVNPSGRLPVTFYRSVEDLPAFEDYGMARRTYRYFDGPVLYPFGYGLSYSRFAYGPVRLSASQVKAGEAVTATVEVRNTSERAGDEVSELYVTPPGLEGASRVMLAGWQRVTLQPGERRELRFALDGAALATTDAQGVRAVRAGSYGVSVGGGQPERGAKAGAVVEVRGAKAVE